MEQKTAVERIYIMDHPVDVIDMSQAVEVLRHRIALGERQFIVAQNPEKIMLASEDNDLRDIIRTKATLVIADGVGLLIAAKLLRLPPLSRVTGIDLFEKLLELAAETGKRVFLFGATPEVNELAAKEIQTRFPGIQIAGRCHGYMQNNEEVVDRIKNAHADFVFVALGSPRQEKWINRHINQLPVQLVMGVGGSFDVMAGQVRRAPTWVQRLGMEWLFRFLMQPTRLRRMLRLPRFLWRVWRNR